MDPPDVWLQLYYKEFSVTFCFFLKQL